MITIPTKSLLLSSLGIILALSGCATAGTADKAALPKTTPEGLALVPDTKADAVYRRPGISLAGYTKIALLDPKVSFRTNWQSDTNHNRMGNRIEDDQVQDMIATGQKLLTEEFSGEPHQERIQRGQDRRSGYHGGQGFHRGLGYFCT